MLLVVKSIDILERPAEEFLALGTTFIFCFRWLTAHRKVALEAVKQVLGLGRHLGLLCLQLGRDESPDGCDRGGRGRY